MLNKRAHTHLKNCDPKISHIILGNIEDSTSSGQVYEQLLSSVISQQISVSAARSIKAKFLSFFDNSFPSYNALLKTKEEDLRSCGLSKQKISYMQNIAEYFRTNKIKNEDFIAMSDEEIIEMLTQIKGVGRWTVDMLLIFTLDRPDVFSLGDNGLLRGCELIYGLKNIKAKDGTMTKEKITHKSFKNRINKISEKWSPHRSLASRYIWQYKDSQK